MDSFTVPYHAVKALVLLSEVKKEVKVLVVLVVLGFMVDDLVKKVAVKVVN